MKTEPTAIVELVRLLAIVASFFGVVITAEEQAGLVAAVLAVIAAISIVLAIWNRLSVFSPKKVEQIAAKAAATGDPTVGDPPKGNVG